MATPEQWQKIKQIVGAALNREPPERSAFLDEACLRDQELRAEVDSLLAAHAEASALSQNPWVTGVAEAYEQSQKIGPYRLIRQLGVGGMGLVWLAEQTEPVRRRVALKLIKAGMYDTAMIQRFQAERQSLAIMDHPAIAKVFDAGSTPEGQPYLVMEFVDGLPITEYCDRKKLGIRGRLQLFIEVCKGVQHAHQKAIIHRDLKPSNILVTEVDGQPVPRIIDFGLAKTTGSALAGQTQYTQVGMFLGTPGYMSPEQLGPGMHDIDTRTDVYSLGVILYELLTGVLPIDTTKWKQQPLEEVLRHVREAMPERPSTQVGMNREGSTARAEARGMEPGQLVSLLRGDLDWIVLKALETDRDRRYETPAALAADVERYLENRTVEARPASAAYRLRKYVRRHAVATATIAVIAALLIVFGVTQAVELRRITRERDRANRITTFMTSMFEVSDPSEARGNSVTAREILDKSSKEIETSLAEDPELKAQMLEVMGTVYEGLGLYPRAEFLFKQSVDIRRHILGPEDPATLGTARRLAWTISEKGRYAEAEKMSRELIDIERRALGPDNRATLLAESNLAWVLELAGRHEEAEKLCRQTLARQQKVLGAEDPDTIESERRLAIVQEKQGRFAAAEKSYRLILDIRRRVFGPENPLTLKASDDLGIVLVEEERYGEAQQLLEQTFSTSSRLLGPDHPDTLIAMGNLATVFENQGRYSDSEKLQREVLARYRRTLGRGHPLTAVALYNIADVLYYQHRYAEAVPPLREAVDIERRVLGATHPDTVDSIYKLGRLLALTRKPAEAISLLNEAVDHGLDPGILVNFEKDTALKSLHGSPRFDALVANAGRRSVEKKQGNN